MSGGKTSAGNMENVLVAWLLKTLLAFWFILQVHTLKDFSKPKPWKALHLYPTREDPTMSPHLPKIKLTSEETFPSELFTFRLT